jgi:Holliday junction resolvasome RuvABC endonuclease subunit
VRENLKAYGCIQMNPKAQMAAKLSDFKEQLITVFRKYNPSYVVIENGYFRGNALTLKVLSYFVAVARQVAYEILDIEPVMVTTTQVRNYFGAKGPGGKEQIFKFIKNYYNLSDFIFKKHNDMTDSIAQGLYFYRKEIKNEVWPEEKLINPRKNPKKKPRKSKKKQKK